MAHRPAKLGRFPLILRNKESRNVRPGELLMDFDNSELYIVNPATGEKISISQNIFNILVNQKIQNTKIKVIDMTKIGANVDNYPPVDLRVTNGMYFKVLNKSEYKESENN